jgi:hypothetical protein
MLAEVRATDSISFSNTLETWWNHLNGNKISIQALYRFTIRSALADWIRHFEQISLADTWWTCFFEFVVTH